jgi:hypothetical protein
LLPAVTASTNGYDRVVWRYGGQTVTATSDRGCYRIKLDPRSGGLQDFERHDDYAIMRSTTISISTAFAT